MGHRIREFDAADTEAVVGLWKSCGLTQPWNDPRADIERKLKVQPELFLVAADTDSASIVGSAMAGYDGHRGWLYYLASDPSRRGERIGADLVAEAESRLRAMGCPKVQLMVRNENTGVLAFYEARGYADAEVHVLGKRLTGD